jgi:hypothetical protein
LLFLLLLTTFGSCTDQKLAKPHNPPPLTLSLFVFKKEKCKKEDGKTPGEEREKPEAHFFCVEGRISRLIAKRQGKKKRAIVNLGIWHGQFRHAF